MTRKKQNNDTLISVALVLGAAVIGGVLMGFRKGSTEVGAALTGYNPDLFSRYYSILDVEKSNTAAEKGIDNTTTDKVLENAAILAQLVLDPLTDFLGARLIINSWYRSKALNQAIGGADASDHLQALAADIENPDGDNAELVTLMLRHDIPFDQVIVYDSLTNPSRIHVSIDPTKSLGDQQYSILLKKNNNYTAISSSNFI